MGKFLDFLTGGGSGLVGSLVNGAVQLWQGNKNRDAQQKENARDRAFNAEQAQVNRQWQEKMFNMYESPQAQAQARAQAGLNPTEGISSQSVGSGSTASASSSSLPPAQAPNFGDAISQLPFITQQYRQAKAQTQALQLDNDLKVQQYEANALDNYRKAFENGNLEEVYKREMRLIDAQADDYIAGANLKDINRKNLEIAYGNAKKAFDDGINPIVDEHEESLSRRGLTDAQTALVNAQTSTENMLRNHRRAQLILQNAAQRLANDIQEEFGQKMAQANYDNIVQRLNEFLESEDLHQQLINAGIEQTQVETWISAVQGMMLNYDYQALQRLYGDEVNVTEALQMWVSGHNTRDGKISFNFGASF